MKKAGKCDAPRGSSSVFLEDKRLNSMFWRRINGWDLKCQNINKESQTGYALLCLFSNLFSVFLCPVFSLTHLCLVCVWFGEWMLLIEKFCKKRICEIWFWFCVQGSLMMSEQQLMRTTSAALKCWGAWPCSSWKIQFFVFLQNFLKICSRKI